MTRNKIFLALFGLILIVGIGFRTYRFHDFLRFNADQSRDATLASEVLVGKAPWPLLGPKAGGTEFKLGSAFYSFQIVSSELFGVTPVSAAYPDLLFSLLAIPLLFLLLRQYFDTKTALRLTAVFALSYFAVKYSRFAWNPNSTPFWSMLFLLALYQSVIPGERKRWWIWPMVLGVAIGIGVELHTLLLALLPMTFVMVFGYALWKQKNSRLWKHIAVAIAFALLINTPQIVAEYQTNGANISAFFHGVSNKQGKAKGLIANLGKDALCLSQGNVYMLSSYDVSDTCETKSIDKVSGLVATGVGFVFLVGGAFLLFRALRRERDEKRQYFLGIIAVYLSLLWLMLVPLAQEVSMRFYLIAPVMPFVLLGLWWAFLRELLGNRVGERLGVAIILFLCLSNAYITMTAFRELGQYTTVPGSGGDFEFITLGEAERAADFIVANTGGKTAILDGNALIIFKGGKSIGYLTKRAGVTLSLKAKNLAPGTPIFSLNRTTTQPDAATSGQPLEKSFIIGRLTISLSRLP